MRYRLDGVVTVVDAVNGEATLDAHAEAVKQAAVADRIVLTKTDLADDRATRAHRRAPARAQSGGADPRCRQGRGDGGALLNCGLYDPERKIPDVKKWLAAEAYADAQSRPRTTIITIVNRHDEHIGAFVLTSRRRDPGRHAGDVPRTAARDPWRQALRLKGIVKLAEMPDTPVVVHGVQHVFHPTARLERWPDDDHRTRLVFITRDLPERTVRELFEAFLGAAAPDRPDRAALTDNPLIPFGGVDR